jgi:hypothetical protein
MVIYVVDIVDMGALKVLHFFNKFRCNLTTTRGRTDLFMRLVMCPPFNDFRAHVTGSNPGYIKKLESDLSKKGLTPITRNLGTCSLLFVLQLWSATWCTRLKKYDVAGSQF